MVSPIVTLSAVVESDEDGNPVATRPVAVSYDEAVKIVEAMTKKSAATKSSGSSHPSVPCQRCDSKNAWWSLGLCSKCEQAWRLAEFGSARVGGMTEEAKGRYAEALKTIHTDGFVWTKSGGHLPPTPEPEAPKEEPKAEK